MTENLDAFYQEMWERTEEDNSLTPGSKVVVLFRVAIETGAKEMGIESVLYLISRLMTTTIGIMAGKDGISYEEILDDLDPSEMLRH